MNSNPYSVSENQTSGDMQSLGPDFDQQLRVMQIIAGALMMGVVTFLGIVVVITRGDVLGQGNPGIITIIAAGFAGLMIVNHLVIPGVITKAQLNQLKAQDSNQNTEVKAGTLLGIYRIQLIITLALLEGAAFFNLVSLIIENHVISLTVATILLGLMVVRFPTRTKVTWWVQDRLRELP